MSMGEYQRGGILMANENKWVIFPSKIKNYTGSKSPVVQFQFTGKAFFYLVDLQHAYHPPLKKLFIKYQLCALYWESENTVMNKMDKVPTLSVLETRRLNRDPRRVFWGFIFKFRYLCPEQVSPSENAMRHLFHLAAKLLSIHIKCNKWSTSSDKC